MRVTVLMASPVLGAVLISAIALVGVPAHAASAKIACPCDCPDQHKAKPRHAQHHDTRDYAGSHYSYREALPVHWHAMQSSLRGPPGHGEPAGLVIDQAGWTGGVGYGEEGGGGGGYGQVLLVNGASQNGPTYNSFGESFQQNPSMPHPFQNRLMGGVAPSGSASRSR